MRTRAGTITLVQESRFQLVGDDGVAHLFVLGKRAASEPSQLAELQRRQARIHVVYKDAKDLIAGVALRIEVSDAGVG